MLWNIILQFAAGAAGYNIFTFQLSGILSCLAVTAVVQGIDMFRYYSRIKRKIMEAPSKVRDKKMQNLKGAQGIFLSVLWYLTKVVCYGLITLLVAFVVRQFA